MSAAEKLNALKAKKKAPAGKAKTKAKDKASGPDFTEMKAVDLNKFYETAVKDKTIGEIDGFEDLGSAAKRKALTSALKEGGEGGKSVTVTQPEQSGTVLPPDPISKTTQEVENLKDETTAHDMIGELIEDTEFNFFKLGGVLSVIQAKEWFGEHENFKEFCTAETSLSYRKASYLTMIYNDLVDANIPWDMVKDLGWTKLKEISGVVTASTVKKWVKKAKSMNTYQLIEEVKASKKTGKDKTPATPSEVSTKTFKFHKDQRETVDAAIDRAKEQSGTEVDSVAIEHICLDFLSGGKKGKGKAAKQLTLTQVFEALRDQNKDDLQAALAPVFEAFESVFPKVNLTVEMPK